jgi:CheY-like chemotaxis protein
MPSGSARRHCKKCANLSPPSGLTPARSLLEDAIACLIEETNRATGVLPDYSINISSPLSVEVSTAVYRIVQEALTNICKHAAATTVQIHLSETTIDLSLVIQDNGRGFRLDQNTTGFGLQGMRERAVATGGWLDIANRQQVAGLRLTFNEASRMIRVLLVDDQSIIRQGLKALELEPDLQVVGGADNGQSAILQVEALQPDVVLMDIRMPVMDGIAATRSICQRFAGTKVLVLTTFDDDAYVAQAPSRC